MKERLTTGVSSAMSNEATNEGPPRKEETYLCPPRIHRRGPVPVVEERQTIDEYDYIVVGSGAGGGPLASRLARAGQSVLLIESGDDQGANYNYSVPGYQAAVTQDPRIAWDVYVNHYQDQARARRDTKYVEGKGILYPRAGTLGFWRSDLHEFARVLAQDVRQ
ncbi:hypothetical protein BST61_g3425 [Cercospora zeina]